MNENTEKQPEAYKYQNKAPCMVCKERYFGCHSECDSYAEFRRIRDAANKQKVINSGYYYVPTNVRKRRNSK